MIEGVLHKTEVERPAGRFRAERLARSGFQRNRRLKGKPLVELVIFIREGIDSQNMRLLPLVHGVEI